MKIVNYKQEFEQELIMLWNNVMMADVISTQRFREKVIFDDNFDPELALVAIEDNKIVGFCFGYKRKYPYLDRGLEPTKGWISVLFVDIKHQNQGIGTKLVKEVESRLISKGAKTIVLGSNSPNYFYPGVDIKNYSDAVSFFEKMGYSDNGEAVSMSRSLWNYQIPQKIQQNEERFLQENIHFMKFQYKYSLQLLDFAKNNFGGGWKRDLFLHMQNGVAEDLIWICLRDEEIIGFCMRGMGGIAERFGPFGVREDFRSKGVGAILFNHMLLDMKSNMIMHVYFLWTDGDAIKFYQRNGMEIVRKYKLMLKEM